jgi:uncharacterized glyoxalase superfamily protein PhnB
VPATIRNITFASEEPERLGRVLARCARLRAPRRAARGAGDREEAIAAGELEAGSWAMLVPPDGGGPRLHFRRHRKTPTEVIPIHLDLEVDDLEAEVERLVGLGATVVETKSNTIGDFTETWTVLRDPEGNGFCVQE